MELEITTEPTGPEAPQTQEPVVNQPSTQQPEPTTQQEPITPEKTPEQTPQEAETAQDEAVNKFVQDAGLDPMVLSKEIATSGDINPEAKKALGEKLEKAGLPAAMIDEYISGQKAVLDAGVKDIMSQAGGEQGWQEMAQWAQSALSDAELAVFNKTMMNADLATAKFTVANMYARFRAEVPNAGQRLKGSTGVTAGDIFKSWEQQKAAQRDARYSSDPAYRAEVEAKIERTLRAGGYKATSR